MTRKQNLVVNDEMELSYRLAENTKKQIKLTVEKSERIKKNPSTKKILYEDYKESFDYVGRLFPDVDVPSIDVRQATPLLLHKLGYDGIGGFFERISKTVIISAHSLAPVPFTRYTIKAKLHKDEVIVHELLHYCHNEIGSNPSMHMKEEFAYGWSSGYLRNKGYTDEEIVRDNYLPYLYNFCYKDGFFDILKSEGVDIEKIRKATQRGRERIIAPLKNKIHKEIIKLATQKGMDIIRRYLKKIEEGDVYNSNIVNRPQHTVFDMIDLD